MEFERDAFEEADVATAGHTLTDEPTHMPPPNASQVAEAFERKLRRQQEEQRLAQAGSYTAFDEDHEKRQEFRRMIDPGIMRPNARHVALESLQVRMDH